MIAEAEINLETWKHIKNYEKYQISNFGRVKSLNRKKEIILKLAKTLNYLKVTLQKNGKSKTFSVHKLVAETFLENKNPIEFKIVNHIDGNKLNNKVYNLEWTSYKNNTKHAIDNKLFIAKTYRISQYTLDGKNLLKIYNSFKEISESTNFNSNSIRHVCKGGKNSYKNFVWKYTDFIYKETNIPEGLSLKEYPNYIITNEGKVYSKSHNRFMSTRNNGGYEYISLGNGIKNGKKDFSIHYLVGKLYIDNPNNYPMLNHINFIKNDNRVENLEWVTYSDNMKHSSNNKKVSVNKLDNDNNIIKTYDSIKNASIENNVSASCISSVLGKKRYKAGGFKWDYNKYKELASSV